MDNLNTIGIDVAKNYLDICFLPSGTVIRVPNSKVGFEQLLKAINNQPNIFRIVIEHTGGYQKELVSFLLNHNLPVSVINPARARFFAKAYGQIAKTDAIDAENLALFGAMHKPPLTQAESPGISDLRGLVHRKNQLIKMITSEKNRLEKRPCKELKQSIERLLKILQKELDKLSKVIQEKIESDEELSRKSKIMQSVSGIGKECSAALIAELPELGKVGRQQIASMVGLAPINRDSGNKKGHAYIQAGRGSLRCALYMPTMVAATQFNPVLRKFYDRLVATGKPKKLVLTACMRKMLVHINSLIAQDYALQNH